MGTINVENLDIDFPDDPWRSMKFGVAIKTEDGKFKSIYQSNSCRSWMGQNILCQKAKKQFLSSKDHKYREEINYTSGDSYALIQFLYEENKQFFINNLKFVHAKEVKAGVKKCVYYETQNPLVLMIEGSFWWKQSAWKWMLWTFYLKCAAYKESIHQDYWKLLKRHNNEGILLSKLKIKREIFSPLVYGSEFTSFTLVHNFNGFLAICLRTILKFLD